MAGIPRLRDYQGPALLSYGFRPFFLFGSLYAGLAVLAWLPVLNGQLELASAFAPRDWHVHEMLYGFVPAVVTGFLLTAIPNWTGRLPIQGLPLLALLAVWIAGRAAVGLSAFTGWIAAAVIDGAFLLLVIAAAAREILAGKNWRNLKVVAIVSILAAGNIAFHLEAHFRGSADFSVRAGVAAVILLITLVGGRVVPSFTRNWLARGKPGRMPSPFGRFDAGNGGGLRRSPPSLDRGAGRSRDGSGSHRGRASCSSAGSPAGQASARFPTGSSLSCMSPTPSCPPALS